MHFVDPLLHAFEMLGGDTSFQLWEVILFGDVVTQVLSSRYWTSARAGRTCENRSSYLLLLKPRRAAMAFGRLGGLV